MNHDALADWVASLDPSERTMLAATIRAGVGETQSRSRRNGTTYDPTVPNAILTALSGGRHRPLSGQNGGRWVTITDVHRMGCSTVESRLPSPTTLKRWAWSGKVLARKTSSGWLIDFDDLERELRKAT